MVRMQGGLVDQSFSANENVIERCIAEIKKVHPDSLADKVFHITIKTKEYTKFIMDGFTFTTDGNGNFSTLVIAGSNTPEIRNLYFLNDVTDCVICFVY